MAFYDEKPSKLEAVGNGSYLYRFNIEEQTIEEQPTEVENPEVESPEVENPETENVATEATEESAPVAEPKTRTQWQCDEVTIFEPLTANKITEAVIASICPATHEQKLVNEYNAANLGMVGGSKTSEEAKKRIAAYKEFLEYRNTLKTQVDEDCAEIGIR